MPRLPVEIRVTPWRNVEGLPEWADSRVVAYRIWQEFDGRHWYQAHEWEYRGGNRERWQEQWIHGVRGWSKDAVPPEPGDDPPP